MASLFLKKEALSGLRNNNLSYSDARQPLRPTCDILKTQ